MSPQLKDSLFPGPWPLGASWLLLVATLLLLPLVVVTSGAEPYVLGKTSLFEAAMALVAALALGGAVLGRRLRFTLVATNGLAVLFVLWCIATALWSSAPALTLDYARRLLWLLVAMFAFQNVVRRSRRSLLVAGYAVMIASALVAAKAIYNDFLYGFSPESLNNARILGDWRDAISAVALGNSGHVADFLAVGFFFWLGNLVFSRSRWRTVVSVGALWLHAAALIVAWSVHSNLSVIAGAVVFVLLLRHIVRRRQLVSQKRRFMALFAGWLLVVGFYVVDHPANPHDSGRWEAQAKADYESFGMELPAEGFSGGIFSQAFASPRWKIGGETRVAIWLTTLDMIRERPFLGAGAGTFPWVYPETITPLVQNDERYARYSGRWTNDAHNDWLQVWSESGIVGLFLLVCLIGASLKAAYDRVNETSFGNAVLIAAAAAALTAQAVQMQMSFPLQLPVSSLLFFLLVTIPHLPERKSGREEAFLVPVQRPYGAFELEVVMRNMARPVEVAGGFALPRPMAHAVAVLLLVVGAFVAWHNLAPLRADIAYAPVRAAKRAMDSGQIPRSAANASRLADDCKAVLATWSGHGNCRSAMQDLLLIAGRYDEVVAVTDDVRRRLNSIEVLTRRAEALDALGRRDEAVADWDETFRRIPEYGALYPRQYGEYVQRQASAPNPSLRR